jgi:hypothetical protein
LKNSLQDARWWEGKRIDIDRAAEPTNIFWENMGIPDSTRIKRSLVTYLITFLLLLAVFGINLGLAMLRDWLAETTQDSGGSSGGIYVLIMLIGIISSIIIAINNSILSRVIKYISEFERHETHTKFRLTIALKETFSMFINTAIIPILVNLGRRNWFGTGDLSIDVFFIVITISFVTPTLHIFDYYYFWKKFWIWYERRKGNE